MRPVPTRGGLVLRDSSENVRESWPRRLTHRHVAPLLVGAEYTVQVPRNLGALSLLVCMSDKIEVAKSLQFATAVSCFEEVFGASFAYSLAAVTVYLRCGRRVQ